MTTKRKKGFWTMLRESAAPARDAPSWMQAGINLTERHYVAFRREKAKSVVVT